MKMIFVTLAFIIGIPSAQAEWLFDFSRRSSQIKTSAEMPAPRDAERSSSIFESLFDSSAPVQEVVIMNTDKGFVPGTIRVKAGMQYRIHVVNINEGEKNISFVMDAFGEHHATYFGQLKTFMIKPTKQGVFTFQCPETSAQGRLVVYPVSSSGRLPASAKE